MNILVTGANGFIGSFLVEKLVQSGHHVRCLVRKTSNLVWLQNQPVEYFYGELADPTTLRGLVNFIDVVFHLAGVTKAKNPQAYYNGNVSTTENLLDICKNEGSKNIKFVFISSQAAGGPSTDGKPVDETSVARPLSLYGKAKLEAEKVVGEYGKKCITTIIRPPSVYGPRDKDIYVMFKNVNSGFYPVLGEGRQQASLIHVFDLVDGIMLAGFSDTANGRLYYLSGDGDYDWLTIGRMMAKALEKKPLVIHAPPFVLDLISWIAVGIFSFSSKPALLNRDKVREMKQPSWLCSNALAKRELGFFPRIDIETGIQQTARWYRENGWLS
ncbi:NAD-dependent epimerase/dehydratase family protein [candidate division KSB1 bacterium]|nr:NAD-dependent epimerase/dehydratase family protein [candidate division KSB1 bacterium]